MPKMTLPACRLPTPRCAKKSRQPSSMTQTHRHHRARLHALSTADRGLRTLATWPSTLSIRAAIAASGRSARRAPPMPAPERRPPFSPRAVAAGGARPFRYPGARGGATAGLTLRAFPPKYRPLRGPNGPRGVSRPAVLSRRFGFELSVPVTAGTGGGRDPQPRHDLEKWFSGFRARSCRNATARTRMTKRHEAKYKIDRRMGQNIWGRPKSPINKREYGPGQHGQRRKGKLSDYGVQLRPSRSSRGITPICRSAISTASTTRPGG